MQFRRAAACLTLPTLIALSACGETATGSDGDAEVSGEAVDAPARAEAADGPGFVMVPGLYTIGSNGTIYAKTKLEPDGTYIDYNPQNVRVGSGTWDVDGASFCFNPRGEDGEARKQRCWNNGAANADGSFTTTLSDGSESYEITPLK